MRGRHDRPRDGHRGWLGCWCVCAAVGLLTACTHSSITTVIDHTESQNLQPRQLLAQWQVWERHHRPRARHSCWLGCWWVCAAVCLLTACAHSSVNIMINILEAKSSSRAGELKGQVRRGHHRARARHRYRLRCWHVCAALWLLNPCTQFDIKGLQDGACCEGYWLACWQSAANRPLARMEPAENSLHRKCLIAGASSSLQGHTLSSRLAQLTSGRQAHGEAAAPGTQRMTLRPAAVVCEAY